MSGESKTTTEHDKIRQWAEERNGMPASVRDTGDADAGVLRIAFARNGEMDDDLEEITWNDFFDKFEKENLAFLYQDTTSSGDTSRFHKFVDRNEARQ